MITQLGTFNFMVLSLTAFTTGNKIEFIATENAHYDDLLSIVYTDVKVLFRCTDASLIMIPSVSEH